MNIKLDKVGADVEFFLRDKDNNPVPCIGLVGGTKDKPLPLLPIAGYMIQEDNVALEWGIPPAPDRYSFLYSCMRAREAIDAKLEPMGLRAVIEPSIRFKPEQLEHPQAKAVGCDVDYNVWEQAINEKPDLSGENETLRSGGGHIHTSFLVDGKPPKFPVHLPYMEAVVKAYDIWLGVASVILDPDKDRRRLYGKAGAFRAKPYGIEYRVLSSFWTRDPLLIDWVYSSVEKVFNWLGKHSNPNSWLDTQKEAVVKIINSGDQAAAQNYMIHTGIQLPK